MRYWWCTQSKKKNTTKPNTNCAKFLFEFIIGFHDVCVLVVAVAISIYQQNVCVSHKNMLCVLNEHMREKKNYESLTSSGKTCTVRNWMHDSNRRYAFLLIKSKIIHTTFEMYVHILLQFKTAFAFALTKRMYRISSWIHVHNTSVVAREFTIQWVEMFEF